MNIASKHQSNQIYKNVLIRLSFFSLFAILRTMTIKTDRLSESIRILATEEILAHSRDYENSHGIISVLEVIISSDKSYADIMLHGQWDDKELTHFVAPIAGNIHTRISRELWLRRTPRIRFRIAKNINQKADILSVINQLDQQYGLSK